MVHEGIELRFGGQGHRIDLSGLTGGKTITVYGQQEVVKDLIAARVESGGELLFEVSDVSVDVDRPARPLRARRRGGGADVRRDRRLRRLPRRLPRGDRGAPDGRTSAPIRSPGSGSSRARKPSSEELIYANHERGFALH